jgi:hypothetical protein
MSGTCGRCGHHEAAGPKGCMRDMEIDPAFTDVTLICGCNEPWHRRR